LTSGIAIKLFGKTDLYGAGYVNSHIALNRDMFTPGYAYHLLPVLLYNDCTWFDVLRNTSTHCACIVCTVVL